jgi:hypothetical protein
LDAQVAVKDAQKTIVKKEAKLTDSVPEHLVSCNKMDAPTVFPDFTHNAKNVASTEIPLRNEECILQTLIDKNATLLPTKFEIVATMWTILFISTFGSFNVAVIFLAMIVTMQAYIFDVRSCILDAQITTMAGYDTVLLLFFDILCFFGKYYKIFRKKVQLRKCMDMPKMKHILKLTDSQLKLAKTDLMYNPNEGLILLDSENIFKVVKSNHKKTLKETTKKVVNETSALKNVTMPSTLFTSESMAQCDNGLPTVETSVSHKVYDKRFIDRFKG